MSREELIKFLKLLKNAGCLDGYWRDRIDEVIRRL